MEDWGKKLDDALQQKQKEKEENEKKEREHIAAKEANRIKAISFVSEKLVPAFVRAEELLQKRDMFAHYKRSDNETSIYIEAHKQGEIVKENQKFEYNIDMIYDQFGVTFIKDGHYIDISTISEDDIFNDIMEHLLIFVKQKL